MYFTENIVIFENLVEAQAMPTPLPEPTWEESGLTQQQQGDLKTLLHSFRHLYLDEPGLNRITSHAIDTGMRNGC